MKREIEFRVWDIEEKEIIDFNYLEVYKDLDAGGFFNIQDVFDNEVWIFMQYTGLKDKNGKKIFEGDICWADEYTFGGLNGVVEYRKGAFFLYSPRTLPTILNFFDSSEIEVTGNIHDNAELLNH